VTDLTKHSEFSLLADLAREGALTSTALTLDPDTPYGQWEALGAMLGALSHASCWLIGDWLEFGERAYGEKYAQAIEETGLAAQTLMNYASVARRVPPERRRAALPYSYHAVVAPLKPREQERWLKKAEREGMKRRELEAAVKGTPEKVTIRDLAQAVWTSAVPLPKRHYIPEDGYFVPAEPMKNLGAAL
jgi:hypothetical protein